MNAVVFEHVPVADLPEQWRARLGKLPGALVTVRIEDDAPAAASAADDAVEAFKTDDPAFGIWRDRDDIADVAAYVRTVREPRFNSDGSRKKR